MEVGVGDAREQTPPRSQRGFRWIIKRQRKETGSWARRAVGSPVLRVCPSTPPSYGGDGGALLQLRVGHRWSSCRRASRMASRRKRGWQWRVGRVKKTARSNSVRGSDARHRLCGRVIAATCRRRALRVARYNNVRFNLAMLFLGVRRDNGGRTTPPVRVAADLDLRLNSLNPWV